MSVSANNIGGALQVFAFKSLPAFAPDLPPRDIFTSNFDEAVAGEGVSVTTRVATSQFGAMNDLANGWESMQASSSAITATVKTKGHDHVFNVTEWDTIGEAQILNTFGNILGKQVANGISVDVYNKVSSSYFTNTVTIASSSNFVYAAPTGSLTYIGAALDNLEVPRGGRYAILTPNTLQAMKASNNLFSTLVYGNSQIVQNGGYAGTNGQVSNSAGTGLFVDGVNIYQSPRLFGATKPLGGDSYSGGDKLIGFAGNSAGLVIAARAPSAFAGVPGAYTYTAVEPTSGWPFLFVAALDMSKPAWRFGIYSLFGSAAGNPNAVIPLLTQTN